MKHTTTTLLGPRFLVTGGSGFIGTNLVANLQRDEVVVLNVDWEPPLCPQQRSSWYRCDILDFSSLLECFREFAPTDVVHLAARTDCDENRLLSDYRQNTDGTANVLRAVKATPTIERLIVASTQFVCRPGYMPAHDHDYSPHTLYGQSKVITEQLTRSAELPCVWSIIRPTTIWGPWLLRHRDQFFRLLQRGWYVHPGRKPCIRSWGYVGNVVFQIRRVMDLPAPMIHSRTLYVGDRPFNLLDWVNGCSRRLRGREVLVVPRLFVRVLAFIGDAAELCSIRFPISSSRYRSMTEDYLTPIEPTLELVGPLPYSMEDGIEETIHWLEGSRTGHVRTFGPAVSDYEAGASSAAADLRRPARPGTSGVACPDEYTVESIRARPNS